MRRPLMMGVLSAAVTVAVGVLGTGTAFAYGAADQPIAQVEISGNCNNPDFALCQEVGLGGVWAWAELDTAGGSGTSGSMDFTLTFFGHPGEGSWWTATSLSDALAAGAFPFFDTSQTYSAYYVLDFFPGTGPDDFIAVVPAVYGHYSSPSSFPAGAQFQTQVAP